MKEYIGTFILNLLIHLNFIDMHKGGRLFWLNECWSTNDNIISPYRSDTRPYIILPPGY